MFNFRFNTVSGINRECAFVNNERFTGNWQIDANGLLQMLAKCDSDHVFSLSEYESHIGKLWWTAEITDTIVAREDYVITVT